MKKSKQMLSKAEVADILGEVLDAIPDDNNDTREALEIAKKEEKEIMVIGGEQIFRLALPIADVLYVTKIQHTFQGDTFFPKFGNEWKKVSESETFETKEGIKFAYFIFKKK